MALSRCVLVCVTRQVSCERLILWGSELAHEHALPLNIVHVAANGTSLLGNPSEGEALDFLFTCAKNQGADLNVLRSDNVVETLVRLARESGAAMMVLGESRHNIKEDDSIIWQLRALLPQTDIQVVSSLE